MWLQGLTWGPGEWEGSRCSLSWSGVQGSRGSLRGRQAGLQLMQAAPGRQWALAELAWVAGSLGCPGGPAGLGRSRGRARWPRMGDARGVLGGRLARAAANARRGGLGPAVEALRSGCSAT